MSDAKTITALQRTVAAQEAELLSLKAERDEAVSRLHEQRGATTRMEAERNEARADAEADNAEAIRSRAERDEARAEVERLRAHWRKVIGGPDVAPGQETEVYETLSATVERYAAERDAARALAGQDCDGMNCPPSDKARAEVVRLREALEVCKRVLANVHPNYTVDAEMHEALRVARAALGEGTP